MRALIALVIVAMLAGSARGDELTLRGRRKKQAALALFVLGSAAIVAAPAFMVLAWNRACPDGVPTPCGTSPLFYIGISLLGGGAAAHAVAMPLHISGSYDLDRAARF